MGSAGARAYNGGLGTPPPAGGQLKAFLTLKRANLALSLKSNASNLEQSTPVNKRRI